MTRTANGIVGIKPTIKKVKLERNCLNVALEDGRIISVPRKLFSFLKKQLAKYLLPMETLSFLIKQMK